MPPSCFFYLSVKPGWGHLSPCQTQSLFLHNAGKMTCAGFSWVNLLSLKGKLMHKRPEQLPDLHWYLSFSSLRADVFLPDFTRLINIWWLALRMRPSVLAARKMLCTHTHGHACAYVCTNTDIIHALRGTHTHTQGQALDVLVNWK